MQWEKSAWITSSFVTNKQWARRTYWYRRNKWNTSRVTGPRDTATRKPVSRDTVTNVCIRQPTIKCIMEKQQGRVTGHRTCSTTPRTSDISRCVENIRRKLHSSGGSWARSPGVQKYDIIIPPPPAPNRNPNSRNTTLSYIIIIIISTVLLCHTAEHFLYVPPVPVVQSLLLLL
jgi:hypothetical protein